LAWVEVDGRIAGPSASLGMTRFRVALHLGLGRDGWTERSTTAATRLGLVLINKQNGATLLHNWRVCFLMPRSRPGALAYPDTRYSSPALPDLSRPEERRRLSGAALKALFNIVKHWQIRDEDARQLLGGISNGAYYQLKQSAGASVKTMEQDRLVRISSLIGIFKSLIILYSQRLADQWMQLPNTNPIFAGRTPLDYILRGGTPAMDVVRRLLDARRGGR
jgi:hypothetical protein